MFKKYLHNQGIQPHSLQLAQLYSTGIIMVNETAVHIFDIDFLFLSQKFIHYQKHGCNKCDVI